MYIEASSPRIEGDAAQLETKWLSYETHCLRFRYHMYGSNVGNITVSF